MFSRDGFRVNWKRRPKGTHSPWLSLGQASGVEAKSFGKGGATVATGTIKKLVSERGFGFITAEDGRDYFFHRSEVESDFDRLVGGEKVNFEVEPSPKGPRAKSVRVA